MEEINLYHLLRYYVRHSLDVVICMLIGLAGAMLFNDYMQTPLYKSNATLLVVSQASSTAQDTTLINNYIELYKSRKVLEPVITKQGGTLSYDSLVSSISAINNKDTGIIKISISSKDASLSKTLVEDSISSFKDEAKTFYKQDNIQVVDNASTPKEAYNVKKSFQLIIGTLAGLMLSLIGLFMLYDYNQSKKESNPKIKDTRNIKTIGLIGHASNVVNKLTKKGNSQKPVGASKKMVVPAEDRIFPVSKRPKAKSKTTTKNK